jgi:hypothetical protein
MGSLNKVSLRAEFDGLKGQFEQLCARGCPRRPETGPNLTTRKRSGNGD